ncbi:MAG: aspartate-semialdehyde dehydrogenase, partial [Planctomycetota bacterium]|nr:aspartate-semialdehyde dehydrogenase [Planctomycetota bacterium]
MIETVALVGATGAVGSIVRLLLEERDFPARQFKFLASARSAGQTITFRGTDHTVEELRPEAFDGVNLVIASTPDDVAKEC